MQFGDVQSCIYGCQLFLNFGHEMLHSKDVPLVHTKRPGLVVKTCLKTFIPRILSAQSSLKVAFEKALVEMVQPW